MHLADAFALPAGYVAHTYRGPEDLPEMHTTLIEYRLHHGDEEMPTLEQMVNSYAHLTTSDAATDIAIIRTDRGERVGYARASHDDIGDGTRDCAVWAPIVPAHLDRPLFTAVAAGMERHFAARVAGVSRVRLRAYSSHPGPGRDPVGEALWLEELGYTATEWGASLRRPHLGDIPDLALPDGVEVRPVAADQVRHIWEVHHEAFRGEWDFHEMTDDEIEEMLDDPVQDPSLWKVAWAGDTVVGQVKPFINHEENAQRGYLRGYTEYISTHRDWRNRGIASALLTMSLRELRDRGMNEAVLGVDTNNPGGAFHVYQRLGFELTRYEAVYTRPFETGAAVSSDNIR